MNTTMQTLFSYDNGDDSESSFGALEEVDPFLDLTKGPKVKKREVQQYTEHGFMLDSGHSVPHSKQIYDYPLINRPPQIYPMVARQLSREALAKASPRPRFSPKRATQAVKAAMNKQLSRLGAKVKFQG